MKENGLKSLMNLWLKMIEWTILRVNEYTSTHKNSLVIKFSYLKEYSSLNNDGSIKFF